MPCLRLSVVHKVISSGALTLFLMCAPTQLAAQERETSIATQGAVRDWFTDLWGDLTAWFSNRVVPTPPQTEPPSESQGDNGCIVDPHGGCD